MDSEAKLFKILADSTRLRLAIILAIKGELCVCELVEALGEPQYKVSRHLGIMRTENLVEVRREGAWMYYRLCNPTSELERCLFECFRECLVKHETIHADLTRLKDAASRK
ncbi:MAG: metalloregulator ArsR/SmtB family transcription factor [Phycisphaerae bacterium]|nr:metalloregulator ArsR/SmtB family transcription factor [Phycisphaerae bacterium]NIR62833.1 metalloregulator ArsR/SmtB family transcription factor [candidate division Zixibacteria bacterium]NIP52724.1 metalloregulator ArsR/SmtB family transcription factor [Phycisphaerae bacterium]NIS51771.1 metalloregulator ArsR/SmtB family transcription factor [Phycisphaerae bacterium]NIU57012.1 metalloregulator ArsR/SmtB family transcription factor [Phycisphaerae bacterium]